MLVGPVAYVERRRLVAIFIRRIFKPRFYSYFFHFYLRRICYHKHNGTILFVLSF